MEPGLDDRGAGSDVCTRGYMRLERKMVWWEKNKAVCLILGYPEAMRSQQRVHG